MDAIYGGYDKRTRLVAPATALRPYLQQAGMATRMAMRSVADPVVAHEATRLPC
jgi:hypothetical protein